METGLITVLTMIKCKRQTLMSCLSPKHKESEYFINSRGKLLRNIKTGDFTDPLVYVSTRRYISARFVRCQAVSLFIPLWLREYRLINYCIRSSTEENHQICQSQMSAVYSLPFHHACCKMTFTFLYACVSVHLCVKNRLTAFAGVKALRRLYVRSQSV